MPGGRRSEREKGGLVKDEAEEWRVECESVKGPSTNGQMPALGLGVSLPSAALTRS